MNKIQHGKVLLVKLVDMDSNHSTDEFTVRSPFSIEDLKVILDKSLDVSELSKSYTFYLSNEVITTTDDLSEENLNIIRYRINNHTEAPFFRADDVIVKIDSSGDTLFFVTYALLLFKMDLLSNKVDLINDFHRIYGAHYNDKTCFSISDNKIFIATSNCVFDNENVLLLENPRPIEKIAALNENLVLLDACCIACYSTNTLSKLFEFPLEKNTKISSFSYFFPFIIFIKNFGNIICKYNVETKEKDEIQSIDSLPIIDVISIRQGSTLICTTCRGVLMVVQEDASVYCLAIEPRVIGKIISDERFLIFYSNNFLYVYELSELIDNRKLVLVRKIVFDDSITDIFSNSYVLFVSSGHNLFRFDLLKLKQH